MSNRFRRRLVAGVLSLSLLAAGCSDDGKEDNAKPEPDGEVVGTGDRYEATIRRTAGGVPHITGDSVADVAFGQGWASGEDRTCDLAEQVLKVTGTRARWLGPGDDEANVESDLAWKAIGIAEVAAKDWTEAPDEVTESITAYVEGWNAHLAEVGADGVGGWCAGEAWVRPLEPVDVYTYARSVALLASSAAVAPMLTTAAPPGAADEATDDGDGAGTADEPDATGATGATEGASAGEAGAGDEDGGSAATTPADGARAADGSSGDASTSATGTGGDAASSPAEPVRVVPRPTTSVPSGRSAAQDRLASLPTDVFDDPALAGLRPEVGSNAWAIGSERSTDGGGMLLANPHFPWEGELRFWEVHLTVPGEVDIYGVQLSGLPGVGIGFTDTFGWSHTVSAGHRFTAYTLDLVEGSPTTYRYGDGTREMTSEEVEVEVLGDDGRRAVTVHGGADDLDALRAHGEIPLPPYIHEDLADPDRYQTVYARRPGSVAAPTAGLHLTTGLLDRLAARGVTVAPIELVVGLGTFRPITAERVEDHPMHRERYRIPPATAALLAARGDRRVVAVGTTVVRALESWAETGEREADTTLFIHGDRPFRVIDRLLTNFHVPRSSLLALVQAFVGPRWRDLYAAALADGYRFLSFGDAMLLDRHLGPGDRP